MVVGSVLGTSCQDPRLAVLLNSAIATPFFGNSLSSEFFADIIAVGYGWYSAVSFLLIVIVGIANSSFLISVVLFVVLSGLPVISLNLLKSAVVLISDQFSVPLFAISLVCLGSFAFSLFRLSAFSSTSANAG